MPPEFIAITIAGFSADFNPDVIPPPGNFGILMETTGYVLMDLPGVDLILME